MARFAMIAISATALVLCCLAAAASVSSALSAAEMAQGEAHLDALLDLALYADMDTALDGMERLPVEQRMTETARTENTVTYSRTEPSDQSTRSITFNIRDDDTALLSTSASAAASASGEGEGEGEAEGEVEGEAEGEAEVEAEGEAESEGGEEASEGGEEAAVEGGEEGAGEGGEEGAEAEGGEEGGEESAEGSEEGEGSEGGDGGGGGGGGGGSCGKDLCKAAGPFASKCTESVCFPLCLGTVFDVEVTAAGGDNDEFNAQVSSGEASAAVQGLFLGIGCSEFAGCCDKGPRLAQWTESKLGGPQVTSLPLPFCKSQQDRAAACAACKVQVSVKPKGAETCEAQFQPAVVADAAAAFERTKTSAPETVHKSFKEKCLAVNDAVTAAQGAMEAAFNGYVCGCLGCCDDQVCPYKVSYSTVAEAMAGANDQ